MLGGKPLFKGRDYVDQLNQILQILGTPDEATLRRVGSERVSNEDRKDQKEIWQTRPHNNPLTHSNVSIFSHDF